MASSVREALGRAEAFVGHDGRRCRRNRREDDDDDDDDEEEAAAGTHCPVALTMGQRWTLLAGVLVAVAYYAWASRDNTAAAAAGGDVVVAPSPSATAPQ